MSPASSSEPAAPPPFATRSEIARYDLNGNHWKQHALGAEVGGDAARLGALLNGWLLFVSDYHLSRKSLECAPKGYEVLEARPDDQPPWNDRPQAERAWLELSHDALIVVDAPGRQYFPTFVPPGEHVRAQRVQPNAAFAALEPTLLGALPQGTDPQPALALYRALLASMLHGSHLHTYLGEWDNTDDTERHGLVTLNLETGELREIVLVNPP
jgi:hypothetical protein